MFYDERRLWKDYNFRFDFDERRIGTERYFGKGSSTDKSAESAYTSNYYLTQVKFGPYLDDVTSLQGTFRIRHFRVGESILNDVPQTLTLFPNDFGIEGGIVFAEGLRLMVDTRNNIFTPTQGEIAVVISNRPEARGLEIARSRGLPAVSLPSRGLDREVYDRMLVAELRERCLP